MSPQPTFGLHNASPRNPGSLHLLLHIALHRFFTFPELRDWHYHISRVDLAKEGYYFLSAGRAVQCYYCHLKLSENLNTDDVSLGSLHRKFSPQCPLLTGSAIQDITINDCTNYRYESHRLFSMLITDWCWPVSPYDLSKHGFYWSGQSDNCVCVFCRLEVRGWKAGDSAEYEHRRWNPNCVFIKNRPVGNIPMGKELDQTSKMNPAVCMNKYASRHSHSINHFACSNGGNYERIIYANNGNGLNVSVEAHGVTPIDPPRHLRYMNYSKRLDSYKLWPMSLSQRPEHMADAGFYYTQSGNRLLCFSCGGGLKDWTPKDTPWYEHARWFPRCQYLILKRGKEFINRIQREISLEIQPNHSFSDATASQRNMTLDEETTLFEPSKTATAGSLLCLLCGIRHVEMIYLPCGHMITCHGCVEKEPNCVRCGSKFVAYVHAFLQ